MPSPLIVIWTDRTPGHRCRWTIRGIKADGVFYGEATFYDERRCANLQGELPACDNAEVWRLATGILEQSRRCEKHEVEAGLAWDGMLAEGPYSAPKVIYRYRRGDEEHSSVADDFKALTALLNSYIRSAFSG